MISFLKEELWCDYIQMKMTRQGPDSENWNSVKKKWLYSTLILIADEILYVNYFPKCDSCLDFFFKLEHIFMFVMKLTGWTKLAIYTIC